MKILYHKLKELIARPAKVAGDLKAQHRRELRKKEIVVEPGNGEEKGEKVRQPDQSSLKSE